MRRRRLVFIGLAIVIILIGIFLLVGLPLIEDTFTPAITGLPPTSQANSLQARYTQTALARASKTP